MNLGQLKIQQKLFLGTFKSHDSDGYDIYFIFLKLCVFEKTGQANRRILLQKGAETEFCSYLEA